jgi:hypothetical protein
LWVRNWWVCRCLRAGWAISLWQIRDNNRGIKKCFREKWVNLGDFWALIYELDCSWGKDECLSGLVSWEVQKFQLTEFVE